MQKCATAPKWIFHRPANAGLLRGMQLGCISQTSTSSCWLAGADQSTEDNHGSKNAPQTTSKNCSRLRCAPALCNSHTFHISIQIRGGEHSSQAQKSYDFFCCCCYVSSSWEPQIRSPSSSSSPHPRKTENLFHALKSSSTRCTAWHLYLLESS